MTDPPIVEIAVRIANVRRLLVVMYAASSVSMLILRSS